MNEKKRTDANSDLVQVVRSLEQSIALLSQSEGVRFAWEQLDAAIKGGDAEAVSEAAEDMVERLNVVSRLTKTVDTIDPHVLELGQFQTLWKKRPKALVQDALVAGKLRERRMLLQAKEAETNRLLAYVAFVASMIALSIPFIERLLGP
jgi:hypothetical protein